ncbi:MAG: helix-turn-helix domain-containing protein [Pseudomonadota bacterium]
MFSIGQLSALTDVKIPTIRYYEQMGLINAPERSVGNQRRYTQHGVDRLSFIRHSRDLGFSIEDIKGLLELSQHPEKPCHDAHGIANKHLKSVRDRIAKLRRLERELKRISACDAEKVANCAVIETLADHDRCETDH